MDIASLGIRVTTQGAKEAANDLDKLQQSGARAEKATQGFGKGASTAAKSAKELQFATRNLPAQFTDIATALGSGQRPLQVLLQQGGQIKDMFGGVGPALRAVGSSVAGWINPFTIVTGVLIGFTAAAIKAQNQTEDLDRAIILSGNHAGLTAAQLRDMAKDLDSTTTATAGKASDVLGQVAATGRFTAEQIQMVAKAAIQMEEATGQAVEETVKQFAQLKDAPVEYILKLNEAGKVNNFLTEAQIRQIEKLREQGKETDAARLAFKVYADTIANRTGELNQHLSASTAVWRDIKRSIGEAGDAVVQFFGDASSAVEKFLARHAEAVKTLANTLSHIPIPLFMGGGNILSSVTNNAVRNNQPQQAARTGGGFNFATASGGRFVDSAEERKHIQAVEDAQRSWNSSIRLGETEAQRLKRELDEAAESGRKLGKTGAEIAAAQQAIRARFAAGNSGGRARAPARQRALPDFSKSAADDLAKQAEAEDRATQSFLDMQAVLDGPLAQAEREHAKRVAELNDLASKSPTAAAGLTDALQKEAEAHAKNVEAIKAELDPMGQLLGGMRNELKLMGLTNAERAVANELLREGKSLTDEYAQAKLAEARALQQSADAQQQSIDLMDDFRRGAADALTEFVTGAKSAKDALKDFFNTLAEEITRAIANKWIQQLFGSQGTSGQGTSGGNMLGSFFGSLFGGGWGGIAKGAAFPAGVTAFASGGVVSSPHLFASAGRLGLMGEAGPEAILPLHRGPDGKLGVRMAANDDMPRHLGPTTVNQTVIVQGRIDSRTPDQFAQATAREQNRAASRNR